MRRMVVLETLVATLVVIGRNVLQSSRVGAGFVNRVVNPLLLGRGLVGSGGSHLATLEHVGRRSGVRRVTPLHPIVQGESVRFAVPLGDRSEWARNVLAAGHCRVQLEDRIIELDEPRLLDPADVPGLGRPLARITGWLGWRYLVLHRFADRPGRLEPSEVVAGEPMAVPGPDGRDAGSVEVAAGSA